MLKAALVIYPSSFNSEPTGHTFISVDVALSLYRARTGTDVGIVRFIELVGIMFGWHLTGWMSVFVWDDVLYCFDENLGRPVIRCGEEGE